MIDKPELLCIGMQKAGTRWLYQVLSQFQNTLMLPIKEFHHFDSINNGTLDSETNLKRLKRAVRNNKSILSQGEFLEFSKAFEAYIKEPMNETYQAMFEVAGDRLTADFTPAYSTLNEKEIAKVKALLPDAKVILIIRDPITRAWSHFNMYLRNKLKQQYLNRDALQKVIEEYATLEELNEFVGSQAFKTRAFPSKIYRRWKKVYTNMLVLDFHEIQITPQEVIKKTAEYLLGREAHANYDLNLTNRKESEPKAKIQLSHLHFLKQLFVNERLYFSSEMPSFAESWIN